MAPDDKCTGINMENIVKVIQYDANHASVLGKIFQQMHINKGLKKFGERATAAGRKEMGQLHERAAIIPVKIEELNDKEREEVIDSILLIEEKRDKTVKGRIVAQGDQQKRFLPKEEVHSPTVNTASVFLTSVIEVK